MLDSLRKIYVTTFLKKRYSPVPEGDNSLRRLFFSHAAGAFILAPIYSIFVIQLDIWKGYVFIGLSYTFLFPVYFFICNYITYFKNKFVAFFTVHLFLITLIGFIGLYISSFEFVPLISFFGLYATCIVIIKRWYALMLYNIFVFLLLMYGLLLSDQTPISELLFVLLFVVLGLASSLALSDFQRQKQSQEKYNLFLEKIMDSSDLGYGYFKYNKRFLLLDYNSKLCSLLNILNPTLFDVSSQLFNQLKKEDLEIIKELVSGSIFQKEIVSIKYGTKRWLELKVHRFNSKENDTYLITLFDITDYRSKIEDVYQLENKYKNLYFRNKAGVFSLDKRSRIIECNDSFSEMFDNTIGKEDFLFDAHLTDEWDLILESLNSSGVTQNYQSKVQLKNGREINLIFNWYLDPFSNLIEGSVIDLTSVQKASKALRQSEEKYKLIYEESNDAILLLENNEIVDVNRKMTQLFGKVSSDLIGTNLFDLSANISDLSKKKYNSNKSGLETSKSIKFDWLFKGKSKNIEAEVTMNEIMFDKKLYYQCVIHDNTEHYNNLRALKKSQRNLENILENNPEGILIVSDKKTLYSNSSAKLLMNNDTQFSNLFIPSDQLEFDKIYATHRLDWKRKNLQLKINSLEGEELLIDVTMVITSYEEEDATLIILKDVSAQKKLDKEKLRAEFAEGENKQLEKEIKERIKTELLLEQQYLRTKAIIDSSNYTFLLTLDLKGNVTAFNKHCHAYFINEFDIEIKTEGHFTTYFKTIISDNRLKEFSKIIRSVQLGNSFQFEARMVGNGKTYWLEVFVSPIFDLNGKVVELSLVAHDSSEKKKASINIEESLREKEILLKEIHHRVKNNLQVISSILNLQSSFVTDENTLEILQESRNRIRSMAIIHENLYRTEDFSSINFSNYLENLTSNLIASYRINEEVELATNLELVDLILDQAIPCGLLVNELITNALKYAWKNGEKGIVTINLYQKGKEVNLEIFDNGVGLPGNYEDLKSETLGLQLVETLIEQLDGEIKVEIEKGTKYFIKFENTKSEINV